MGEADNHKRCVNDYTQCEERNNLFIKAHSLPLLLHLLCLDQEALIAEGARSPNLILICHQVEPKSHKREPPPQPDLLFVHQPARAIPPGKNLQSLSLVMQVHSIT